MSFLTSRVRIMLNVFRSVCFTCPHSERQVINRMSFTILAGQLCVIVGENGRRLVSELIWVLNYPPGCGKSTTVQLFNRLYDATSGDLLIDGRPIHDFTLGSLRSGSSIMYQDYKHLPLTVCFTLFQILFTYAPNPVDTREYSASPARLPASRGGC